MTIPGFLSDTQLKRLEEAHPEVKSQTCPTCQGNGHYKWQGETKECLCTEQKRLHVRYLHAGIGATYQRLGWGDVHFDLADLPLCSYLDNAEDYISRGMGILLHGPMGTGKTLLANLVLKELVKKKFDCYAATFAATVENFTATWGNNDEKQVFADRFMHSQVLLLDDLGKEYKSSTRLSATTFDHILRTRVQAGRPTILTTNMTAQELQGGYGGSVLSLLIEQSIEIELKGEDYRPQSNLRTRQEIETKNIRPIV